MKKLLVTVLLLVTVIICFQFSTCLQSSTEDAEAGAGADDDYLTFATLSPNTPYDVDTTLENQLLREGKLPEAQRLFEVLSWQLFISLNWPRNAEGKPMPNITDSGHLVWEGWKESFEIFKEDGSAPSAWGSNTDIPIKFKGKIKDTGTEDILFRTSKFNTFNKENIKKKKWVKKFTDKADEINQAFTSPIWDQNGNIVRYEIRLNKQVVDYIVQNELYNIDGQIAFSRANKPVSFPLGNRNTMGTIELKLAWKIMDPDRDFPERYFTKMAYVLDKNNTLSQRLVGLVGMHISCRTASSPQWIWATFEQVDNLETNELEKINGRRLKPSFYDPDCSTCPVNLIPDTNQKVIRNQIQRVLPVNMATQQLNRQVQALLKEKNSFWQYYQLIGTQWPTQPTASAYPVDTTVYLLPQAVTNKAGGNPVPTYLTNMIMETYFQGGTVVGNGTTTQSMYNKYLGNEPAYFQIEGFPQTVDTANTLKTIFGTEGCIGCHHSAGVAIGDTVINNVRLAKYGKPGSGDFEWLLQLKAQFKQTPSAK